MKDNIETMLHYLSQLTEEEANFIADILSWSQEDKIAFMLAKKIFEEDLAKSSKKIGEEEI